MDEETQPVNIPEGGQPTDDTGNLSGDELFESAFDFQNNLINPEHKKKFPAIGRDAVLSNLKENQIIEARMLVELIEVLLNANLKEAAEIFQADLQSLLVLNRSLNGFERMMLTTQTQVMKGNMIYPGMIGQQQQEKRGGLFGMFKKR